MPPSPSRQNPLRPSAETVVGALHLERMNSSFYPHDSCSTYISFLPVPLCLREKNVKKHILLTEARRHKENHFSTIHTQRPGPLLSSTPQPPSQIYSVNPALSPCLCASVRKMSRSTFLSQRHEGTERTASAKSTHPTPWAAVVINSAAPIADPQRHSCPSVRGCHSMQSRDVAASTTRCHIVRIFCRSHKLLWSQPAIQVDILPPNDGITSLPFNSLLPDVRRKAADAGAVCPCCRAATRRTAQEPGNIDGSGFTLSRTACRERFQ